MNSSSSDMKSGNRLLNAIRVIRLRLGKFLGSPRTEHATRSEKTSKGPDAYETPEGPMEGCRTVVITETGTQFWGYPEHTYRLLLAIKRNLPETRFLFFIHPDHAGIFADFKGVWEEASVVYSREEDRHALRMTLASFNPYLVFVHGSAVKEALFIKEKEGYAWKLLLSSFCPTISFTPHPYDRYLWLDKNHIFLMKILPGFDNATAMQVAAHELALVRERLMPMLVEKSFGALERRHREAYQLHLSQFKGFRERYKRIILFSYVNYRNLLADPMNHLRTFFGGLPKDWLVVFTIHPSYKVNRELLDLMNRNKEFDVNLHHEIMNQPGDYRPLELLKCEFPNLLTENDLEIKRIHGTPEMPFLTDFVIGFCDAVVCNPNSKTSFRAMETGKPVFAYWREPNDFCYRLLGLQQDDLAAYDFSKGIPTDLYEKVLHFLFTRVLHMPMLGADTDFQRFLQYVDHEREKIDRGLGVVDIGFYDRENQGIGEVLEIVVAADGKDPV
jgi:hypothetical protein